MEAKHTTGSMAAKTVGYIARHPQQTARLIKTQRAARAYQNQYIDGVVTLTPVIEVTPEVVRACNAHADLVDAAKSAEAVFARQKWVDGSTDPEAVALRKLRAALAKAGAA